MEALNLPTYSFTIKEEQGKKFILDLLRQKFVMLTPEEWVRQHFIHYLISDRKFPKGLISVERQLKLNRTTKRTDIVIYNTAGIPLILVECKAPSIEVNQLWFDQAFVYNMKMNASYIFLTNGLKHFCMKVKADKSGVEFLPYVPRWDEVVGENA